MWMDLYVILALVLLLLGLSGVNLIWLTGVSKRLAGFEAMVSRPEPEGTPSPEDPERWRKNVL